MKTNKSIILSAAVVCAMGGMLTTSCSNSSKGQENSKDTVVVIQQKTDTVVVQAEKENPTSQPEAATLVYSIASDGYTNIRSAANKNAEVVGELRNGTGSAVLLQTNGDWYKVDYNGTVGYVHKSQVKIAKNSNAASKIVSVASDGYTNIHSGPSIDDEVIGEIRNNVGKATVISQSGQWYKVNFDGTVGYVHKSQVKVVK